MTFDEAYRKVRSQRSIMYPNDGFVQQLKEYGSDIEYRRKGQVENRRNSGRKQYFDLAVTPDKKSKKITTISPSKRKSESLNPQATRIL